MHIHVYRHLCARYRRGGLCVCGVVLPCMALAVVPHMPPVSAQTLPRKCSMSGTVEMDSSCNRAHVAYVAVSGMLTTTTDCDGVFSFRDTEACALNGSVHVLRHNVPEFCRSVPKLPVRPLRLRIPSDSLTRTCVCAACPSAPTIRHFTTQRPSLSAVTAAILAASMDIGHIGYGLLLIGF